MQKSVVIVVAWCALGSGVAAQPAQQGDDATRAAARQLGEQGIEAFRADDFVTADAKLDRAYRLFATPTLGLWSARARQQLGHWVEAAERFREAARTSEAVGDSNAQKQAQRDAAQDLAALAPRIPSLTIQLQHAEASEVQVTLDGARVPSGLIGIPRPTDPGAHELVAVRGAERRVSSLRLLEKEQKTVSFEFLGPVAASEPAPAPYQPTPTPPQPIPDQPAPAGARASWLQPTAIVVAAVGGAVLATSGVTALIANGKLDDCPNHLCRTAATKSSYDSVRTVSVVTFYAGAALAVGGIVSWLVARGSESQQPDAISWSIGPTGAAVQGRF